MRAIYKRELKSFFHSFVGWLIGLILALFRKDTHGQDRNGHDKKEHDTL